MKRLLVFLIFGIALISSGTKCSGEKNDEARAATSSGSSGEVPLAPSNLTANATSVSQINLSWTDNSGNEVYFKIERKTEGGSYAEVAQVAMDVTSYSDNGLTASTLYYYRVRAANNIGNSDYSNEASATTQDPPLTAPNAPTGLTQNFDSTNWRVNLSWTDNSTNEEKFKIERKPDGGVYSEFAQTNADVANYADSTVSPNTTYWYRLRASNSVGDSAYSNEVSVTTPWRITVVDKPAGVSVGEFTSLGVDSNDKIHISYYGRQLAGDLKYATNASGSWIITVIDDSPFGYDVGRDTSLAVDSNNKIHISYLDDTNVDLKYATNASGSWIIETIDSVGTVGRWGSIAVDSNNKVHISYFDSTKLDLKYATNASGSWVISTLDSAGDVGERSSIAVDSNNKVHISYYDFTNGTLKYATNVSGSWVISTLDSAGDVGWQSDVVVDSGNKIHISYRDSTNADLKYATNATGSWVISTIDSAGDVGDEPSIAIDTSNKVHISYEDNTNTRLKYATNVSGSWQIFVVDDPIGRRVGSYTSIGVDSQEKVHISYLDWTESAYYSLRYATTK